MGLKDVTVGTGDRQIAIELITPLTLVSSRLQSVLLRTRVAFTFAKGPVAVGSVPMPPPPTTSSPVGQADVTMPGVEVWVLTSS